ncbi:MAG: hypothetical protein ACLTSG_04715 [Lachnospiraceae bacterium]
MKLMLKTSGSGVGVGWALSEGAALSSVSFPADMEGGLVGPSVSAVGPPRRSAGSRP